MIRPVVCLVMSVAMLATGTNAFATPSKHTSCLSFAKPAATVRHHDVVSMEASSSSNDEVFVEKDFRLSGIFLTAGLLLDQIPYIQLTLGPLITLLGVIFLVQTFRLKFACDSTSFYLENTSQESDENLIVGGENRWAYSSFVNYDFFPKGWIDQPQGPILVYFKETQTPSEKWSEGPGGIANSDESLAKGITPGQVHFFPALCNTKQLRAEWDKRGCKKV
jgi:hypothetical protein